MVQKLNEEFLLAIKATVSCSTFILSKLFISMKAVSEWLLLMLFDNLLCSPVLVWEINSDVPSARSSSQILQYGF